MSIETESEVGTAETIADLLHQLGDIDPSRVMAHPAPGTATEEHVIAYEAARRKRLCELIDGVLVEKGMCYTETILAIWLAELLNRYVRPRNLGLVAGESGMVRLFPRNVRMPDVAFASWERFEGRKRSDAPISAAVPELAVEILSPSNTKREMERKRRDYFAAGVLLVWEIEPRLRTVSVYTSPEHPIVLGASEELTGGDVLPEFRLNLAELFAELDRQG